jgi:hypothetical protein
MNLANNHDCIKWLHFLILQSSEYNSHEKISSLATGLLESKISAKRIIGRHLKSVMKFAVLM